MFEVFSLPPFLGDLEFGLLLHTCVQYRACVASALRIQPFSATSQHTHSRSILLSGRLALLLTWMVHLVLISLLEHDAFFGRLRSHPYADDLLVETPTEEQLNSPRTHGDPRSPAPSFSSTVSYVVQKGVRAEQSWWPNSRGMRQLIRWLSGQPMLEPPARRLAEHHAWIVGDEAASKKLQSPGADAFTTPVKSKVAGNSNFSRQSSSDLL